jgi:hypothetical protein
MDNVKKLAAVIGIVRFPTQISPMSVTQPLRFERFKRKIIFLNIGLFQTLSDAIAKFTQTQSSRHECPCSLFPAKHQL